MTQLTSMGQKTPNNHPDPLLDPQETNPSTDHSIDPSKHPFNEPLNGPPKNAQQTQKSPFHKQQQHQQTKGSN